MLERITHFFTDKRKDSSGTYASTEENPINDEGFLNFVRLGVEAGKRLQQGGDAAEEQKTISTICGFLREVRLEQRKSQIEMSQQLGIALYDLENAEIGLIEPERFVGVLPAWSHLLGYSSESLITAMNRINHDSSECSGDNMSI